MKTSHVGKQRCYNGYLLILKKPVKIESQTRGSLSGFYFEESKRKIKEIFWIESLQGDNKAQKIKKKKK